MVSYGGADGKSCVYSKIVLSVCRRVSHEWRQISSVWWFLRMSLQLHYRSAFPFRSRTPWNHLGARSFDNRQNSIVCRNSCNECGLWVLWHKLAIIIERDPLWVTCRQRTYYWQTQATIQVFFEVLMNGREALYLSSTVMRQSYQVRQATIQKAQPDWGDVFQSIAKYVPSFDCLQSVSPLLFYSVYKPARNL